MNTVFPRKDLIECPFCGHANGERPPWHVEIHFNVGEAQFHKPPFRVTCRVCGAQGPWGETEADAAAAWNERLFTPHG